MLHAQRCQFSAHNATSHHPDFFFGRTARDARSLGLPKRKVAVGGFSEVMAKEVGPLGIKVTVVEPGDMRTDWAGSSMRVGAVEPDYQKTVGAMIEARSANAGIMRGDPARVARAILRIASEKR